MFLSIIIPVYNAERYLGECLSSCLNQDLNFCEYEIICVNDGSEDNSLEILYKYAKNNSNIVVVNQPNSGVSMARNKGIFIAKGKHIWFVDADDFIKPNCLGKLKKIFEEGYDVINFYGYNFSEKFTEEEYVLLREGKIKQNKTYWGYVLLHVYKTCLIKDNDILFNSDIKYGEDEVFNHEIFAKTENMCQIEDVLYFYRKNPNSTMSSLLQDVEKQKRRLESVIVSMVILKEGIENRKYTKDFSFNFLKERYDLCQYCFKRLDIKTVRKYFKEMNEYGLFEVNKLKELELPNKQKMIVTYLFQHFKIWKRAFYKRSRTRIKEILPVPMVCFIKWIFRMYD